MNNAYLPFIIIAMTHIMACDFRMFKLRRATKILILPALAAGYILSSAAPITSKLLALAFGWAGELLFIRPDKVWERIAGVACFFAGHVFYALTMLRFLRPPEHLEYCILLWVLTLIAAAAVCRRLLPIMSPRLRVPGIAYFLLLTVVACISAALLVQGHSGGALLFTGSLVFLLCDSLLCLENFTERTQPEKYDVAVMVSYVTAQFLLTLGLKA